MRPSLQLQVYSYLVPLSLKSPAVQMSYSSGKPHLLLLQQQLFTCYTIPLYCSCFSSSSVTSCTALRFKLRQHLLKDFFSDLLNLVFPQHIAYVFALWHDCLFYSSLIWLSLHNVISMGREIMPIFLNILSTVLEISKPLIFIKLFVL